VYELTLRKLRSFVKRVMNLHHMGMQV